jgi:carbon-monoxide dehydrogenase small subunit
MQKLVNLEINGNHQEISVEPYETLLQVLRKDSHLKGAKRGCDSGGCGCCTVHVDDKAVYSCMVFANSLEGRKVTTIEGLSEGSELDPLQKAFVEHGAVQCGYCTCGMIMSAKELLARNEPLDEAQIRQGIAGNLCRCTGYTKIVDAIKKAGESR